MQNLLDWLRQPYPFERRWSRTFASAACAGLFVLFFLYFFKPFGIRVDEGAEGRFLRVCAYFGLVTAGVMVLIESACRFMPGIFQEEKWRVWKELVFNIFFISCIGFANLLLAHFLWRMPLDGRMFWTWQGWTFAVGIFPTLIGAFLTQLKLNKRYTAEAATLTRQMHPAFVKTSAGSTAPVTATLTGDNHNETLRLDTACIVCLSAADNYVQVFFFENGVLKNRMLRATLKKMEDALAAHGQFFRCHRTWLVNLEKVQHVSGNAQGYRLHLESMAESVPVSRNLNEEMRQRL